MSERVSWIAILIEDDRVGNLRKESLGNRDVRLWRVPGCLRWGSDDLGSKGSQCGHLKLKLLWRQKNKMRSKCATFSADIFSGRTITQRYPLTAAARASPMPVFPDVGSMIVSPCNSNQSPSKSFVDISCRVTGLSWPAFSASSTIRRAILSFTEPPALKNSHFATETMNRKLCHGIQLCFNLHISHLSPAD